MNISYESVFLHMPAETRAWWLKRLEKERAAEAKAAKGGSTYTPGSGGPHIGQK